MSRYPSDEELYRFIEELEKEELYAPGHLKEEILLKVNEEEAHRSPADFHDSGSGREQCEQGRFSEKGLEYSRKMGAGEG